MQKRKQQITLATLVGIGLWLIGLAVVGLPHKSALAALPPRPTPKATLVPTKSSETGGYIKLQVEAAPADMWTMVQWKDAHGSWHDVGGWQGTLDDKATKLWWVAPKDFATGPFRWAAYDGLEGQLLGLSAEFNLPASAKQIVLIELVLETDVE